jgi:hypothetical protein
LLIEIKKKTRETINTKTKKAMNYMKLKNMTLRLGRPWVI